MNGFNQTLKAKIPKNHQFVVKGVQICPYCIDSRTIKFPKGLYCTKCTTMWVRKIKIQKQPEWGDYLDDD